MTRRPTPRTSWPSVPAGDLPEGLVLYDGVCVMCSRWAAFVVARDAAGLFRFAPVQSPYGRAVAERLGVDPERLETNAVVLGGRAHFKSRAALEALARLPGWGWAGALRALPRAPLDRMYDNVARNRYRLFGRTETCPVPTGPLRARVLTEPPPVGP